MGSESKKPNKVQRFFEKIDSKLRKTRFVNRIVSVYEGIAERGDRSMRSTSPFLHPIDFYHEINQTDLKKQGAVNATSANKTNALGQTIRMRLVNGPELNILLFGVPFLIDFAVSGVVNEVKKAKQQKKKKPGQRAQVHVAVPDKQFLKFKKVDQTPLPSAPFSDKAHTNLYLALIDAGMSKEGARKFASGEYEGQELSDHLSAEDVQAAIDFLTADNVTKFELELVD